MIRVIDEPSVSNPQDRRAEVERHAEPAAHLRQAERELLRVAGAVGRVVDRACEPCPAVAQCRFQGDGLVEVEDLLATPVFGEQS